jgi:iron complex outermembrane receptor protein
MRRKYFIRATVLSLIASFILNSYGLAEEKKTEELPEVVVKGERIIVPTKETAETVYTGVEVTKEGIEISGEKGKGSVWEAISIIPGVVFESVDPANLAAEQSNIRIRGVRGYLGGMTVQGVPNYGGNPIGPRAYIYDLENFESIAVYKGAIPVDLGAGVGNRAGLIELRPKWADEKFGFKLKGAYGNFDYKRIYTRIDTGKITPLNTRSSIAYSYAESDKWKGPGRLGPRHNINFTLVQPLSKNLEIRFLTNFNEIEYDQYRYLSYDQARDVSEYRRLDYNEDLTGNPNQDWLYYKYNKAKHINRDYMGFVDFKPNENLKFSLKAYYLNEDAKIWGGISKLQGKPGVQKRTRDIEKKGLIPEVCLNFKGVNLVLGYQYEEADMKIYAENYWIENGTLTYRGYGILATTGKTYISSPYAKLAGSFGNFNWQAGIKYFRFKDADSIGYASKIVNGTHILERAPDLDREGRVYDIWLPTAGVSYSFTPNLEIYASYGKNFIRPYAYMPIINTYNRLRTQFQAAGITLNDLFKGYDIERSDNYDLGLRFRHELIEITPTIFYSKHKKLLTTISDPRVTDTSTGKPVNYQQNIGEATGYGFELSVNLRPAKNLTFFVNPTYVHLTYDEDITYAGNTLDTEGKQVVDVPRWSAIAGIIWKYRNFTVTPIVRYVGKRYGDAEHAEKIPSYVVCDLRVSYEREKFYSLKDFRAGFEIDNLFDKKYISVINAMDDAVSGTSYGVGAPFSVKAFISFSF